ncbi:GGDEF domain-containing protein [Anaeroselena agilis]|uniref:GGDEF domain-containing protein n=1 Tax=Anaeroselena agilis TaxID=3063788 RepID=A0ABU3NZC9_9FIRM|nr:GGDEF domain-containing protein [Selenomonadales bacterium 4137-cl]
MNSSPGCRKPQEHGQFRPAVPAAAVPAGLPDYGEATIGDIAKQSPAVDGQLIVAETRALFPDGNLQGIVVVEEGKPVGLVMKNELYYRLGSQYGVPLYYKRPIRRLMDAHPLVVDYGLSLETVSRQAMAREEAKLYDLIIVTREGRYWGTVSIIDLLRHITDRQIRCAANANPLTGLPGNLVIEERLKSLVRGDKPFAVLYIDLDNFKAFNDRYGFEQGDRALLLTSDILSQAIVACDDSGGDFLGHIGGDDFIIISRPEKAEPLCQSVITRFDREFRRLYAPDDLARGYITVLNRKGQEENYPLTTVSIAVVDNLERQFTNYLEIGEIAAQLKRRAKAIEGSVYLTDRRKQPPDKN